MDKQRFYTSHGDSQRPELDLSAPGADRYIYARVYDNGNFPVSLRFPLIHAWHCESCNGDGFYPTIATITKLTGAPS